MALSSEPELLTKIWLMVDVIPVGREGAKKRRVFEEERLIKMAHILEQWAFSVPCINMLECKTRCVDSKFCQVFFVHVL